MNRSLAKNFEDGYRAFNMIERRKTHATAGGIPDGNP